MGRFPIARDVMERTLATFVVTVLGLATADGVDLQNVLDVDNWRTWVTAGIVAAFTLVKSAIAVKVGGRSASLDPAVSLAPTEPVTP
jgi:methyl coenzyme M reductase beta subunit